MRKYMINKYKPLIISSSFLLNCCANTGHDDSGKFFSDNHKKDSSHLYILFNNDVPLVDLSCLDKIEHFRKIDHQNYKNFKAEYDIIIDGFNFLEQNANIMTAETKRIYEMKMDVHINLLCTKLQYSGYKIMKEKLANENLASN